jgi:hypothetical protein
MHNAADDAAIVNPFHTANIGRQVRLNPSPLLLAQPKQIPAHDPDPLPKTNQDRIVRAQKLMSFDPNPSLRQASRRRLPHKSRTRCSVIAGGFSLFQSKTHRNAFWNSRE